MALFICDNMNGDKRLPWSLDSSSSICLNCEKDFTFYRRKHHCRCCGQLFCNECSAKTISFGTREEERVCDSCFLVIHCVVR